MRALARPLFLTAAVCMSACAGQKIVVPKDVPSIQKALEKAGEGDTVFVLNGIYKESVTLKEGAVLLGQDKEKTVLRGKRSGPVVRGTNYAMIRNFTVEQGETGILCENTNTVIRETIVRDNGTGIHCLVSLPVIENNVIYHNRRTGIFCELIAYGMATSIQHNIVADNQYCGIMLARKSSVLVQNNLLCDNKQYGIFVDVESKRARIVYNDLFGNRQAFNNYAVIDETNVSKDPHLSIDRMGVPDFFGAAAASPLKGLGKDGADIGLMSDADQSGLSSGAEGTAVPDTVPADTTGKKK